MSDAWSLTGALSPRLTVRVANATVTGDVLNKYDHSARVTGEEPGTPWAMYLTGTDHKYRLLCFDLDCKEPELREIVSRQAQALSEALTEQGIEHVVCESGPGGGRHVWVALADHLEPELVHGLSRSMKREYTRLDLAPLLNKEAGCVRPPLAPHRNGGHSEPISGDLDVLINPTTTEAQVSALYRAQLDRNSTLFGIDEIAQKRAQKTTSGLGADIHAGGSLPGKKRPLSKRGNELLNTTPPPGRASEHAMSVTLAAVHARWTINDLAALIDTAPGLESFRTQSHENGARVSRDGHRQMERLALTWNNALMYAAEHGRTEHTMLDDEIDQAAYEIALQVEAVQTRADASRGRWGRDGGASDRRVLDALCFFTLLAIQPVIEADTRRLAERTGISQSTVKNALQRLAADGWVRMKKRAEGTNGAYWTVTPKKVINRERATRYSQDHTPPAPPLQGAGTDHRCALLRALKSRLDTVRHDLFTNTSRAIHAGNVYSRLSTTAHDPNTLLDTSDQDVDGLFDGLRVLGNYGVILFHTEGYRMPDIDQRDKAAARLGRTGRLQHRFERHRIERELWAWWRAEEEWMNTPAAKRKPRAAIGALTLVGSRPHYKYPRYPSGHADHWTARYFIETGKLPMRLDRTLSPYTRVFKPYDSNKKKETSVRFA